ncbi:MAG: GspE/PulE family protein [bacterium]
MTIEDIDDKLFTLISGLNKFDDDQINELMKLKAQSDRTLAYHLLDKNIVDDFEMRGYLEEITGYEAFDPNYIDWDKEQKIEYSRLLPVGLMKENFIFPINKKSNKLGLAMLNPTDEKIKKIVAARCGCEIDAFVAHEKAFELSFNKNLEGLEEEPCQPDFEKKGYFYEPIDRLKKETLSLLNQEDNWQKDDEVFNKVLHETPVLLLVQEIINEIMAGGASDIHFEPFEDKYRIRIRRDGNLKTMWEFPKSFGPVINGRILLAAGLDPRPDPLPRDARIGYSLVYKHNIEYRVSVLPVLAGEKIVLRSIDLDEGTIPLDVMGFSERDLKVLRKGLSQPTGMVLITGPTGSGKTTTLYSALEERNDESISITTAEDPVEANLEGICQVSCGSEEEEGVSFAAALKSFLRQDPDIIMVGEIRDKETGEIAIEAAMTGHLVLSTLHTNSSAETVNRLLNMQIPPYLISAGLSVVLAQRLIRTLCDNCKKEAGPPDDIFTKFNLNPDDFSDFTFYEATGCEKCENGYKGRTGLFEVLEIDDNIREGIFNRESIQQIEKRAHDQGFTSLLEDGFGKVKQGITTLEEVMARTV